MRLFHFLVSSHLHTNCDHMQLVLAFGPDLGHSRVCVDHIAVFYFILLFLFYVFLK